MKEKLNNWKFLLILIAVGIIVVLMLFAFLVDKREAKLSLSSDVDYREDLGGAGGSRGGSDNAGAFLLI